jgi:glycosyltransferase involved in cell wall biosynthesis
MAPLVSVIVLTKDEEKNLPHLLESLEGLDHELFVVDSGSTDRTVELARAVGATVVFHPFETQARSLNWAIENLPLRAPWTMRLDADERLTNALVEELKSTLLDTADNVTAYWVKCRVHFWGRWIKHGDMYPLWLLRVWRTSAGRYEDRMMDEHFLVSCGDSGKLKNDIIDENRKGFGYWITKHNSYSDREVHDILDYWKSGTTYNKIAQGKARRRRFAKEVIYWRLPLFIRPFLYFLFRYVVKLGFLDGIPGFIFHFNQGLWYRLAIDIKLAEKMRSTI